MRRNCISTSTPSVKGSTLASRNWSFERHLEETEISLKWSSIRDPIVRQDDNVTNWIWGGTKQYLENLKQLRWHTMPEFWLLWTVNDPCHEWTSIITSSSSKFRRVLPSIPLSLPLMSMLINHSELDSATKPGARKRLRSWGSRLWGKPRWKNFSPKKLTSILSFSGVLVTWSVKLRGRRLLWKHFALEITPQLDNSCWRVIAVFAMILKFLVRSWIDSSTPRWNMKASCTGLAWLAVDLADAPWVWSTGKKPNRSSALSTTSWRLISPRSLGPPSS